MLFNIIYASSIGDAMSQNQDLKKKPGRPPTGKARNICVTISLPPDLHSALKKLGGSPWVQDQIRKAITKGTSTALEVNHG